MKTYQDSVTGYVVTQYTSGPDRHAKLYFTTENFSVDDRFFFMQRTDVSNPYHEVPTGLFRVKVETGEIAQLADSNYDYFAMHWTKDWGIIVRRDGMIMRLNVHSGEMNDLGMLPRGAQPQGHLTIANDGRVGCSVQLANKIFALVVLDPDKSEAEIIHLTDQWIGHAQICPTDSNLLFYVHETGGDALQRTWIFDINNRTACPYYVEKPDEWITHETWTADGCAIVFMSIPGKIIIGDKDGRHFNTVFCTKKSIQHPGITRDRQWVCCDMHWMHKNGLVRGAIALVNPRNGKWEVLAHTKGDARTGRDHLHPSFNRAGDKILFSAPDENGTAQVCMIDLQQVQRP
ncbi:MAG: hypothetical protein ACOX63_14660 [Christensenellales bacterium]|jgi:hypothetical protein